MAPSTEQAVPPATTDDTERTQFTLYISTAYEQAVRTRQTRSANAKDLKPRFTASYYLKQHGGWPRFEDCHQISVLRQVYPRASSFVLGSREGSSMTAKDWVTYHEQFGQAIAEKTNISSIKSVYLPPKEFSDVVGDSKDVQRFDSHSSDYLEQCLDRETHNRIAEHAYQNAYKAGDGITDLVAANLLSDILPSIAEAAGNNMSKKSLKHDTQSKESLNFMLNSLV